MGRIGNIINRKGKQDAKRASVFTKHARAIAVAAKEGGADPEYNAALKTAIDKAKADNMPNDNIKRAVDKGAGAGAGEDYFANTYEGYGPGGVAVIVETLTDNKNRTAGNIRYYGASPNNYVYFNCDSYPSTNCELWRIIGVFDGKVKLIRNESIGKYSWDNKNTTTGAETAYGKNDWTTARLMKLLNPSTYYTTDTNDNGKGQSLYWNATSGTCYSGQNNATISCNFTSTGIKNDTTRNMIAETTWNLGGWNSTKIYSNVMYEKERGTTWTGKIALPYPSDYGYATDLSKCSQTLYNYDSSTDSYACRSNDWMYPILGTSSNSWLLTPNSGNANYAFNVTSAGYVNFNRSVCYANGVAPVLYLGSNQDIVAGDGSQSNPYQLANS